MTSHDMRAFGLDALAPAALVDLPRIRERRGVLFLAVRTNSRPAIATTIERLIDFLDAQEVDPDLEPNGDELDDDEREDDARDFAFGWADDDPDMPQEGLPWLGEAGAYLSDPRAVAQVQR